MSDTLTNIDLTAGEWIDLYAASGITVGDAINVENIGVCDVYLAVQAAQPDKDHDAYNVLQRFNGVRLKNTIGDAGAWAFCPNVGGKVNVGPTDAAGFYPPVAAMRFVDGSGDELFLESNGGVPVNVQDQHSKMIDLYFIQSQGATTLAADVAADAYTLELVDATGFVDGNYVGVFSPTGIFYFGTQLGAPVGNLITLDTPLDNNFPSGSNVIRGTRDMNVDGSGTRQIFQIGPVGGTTDIEVDITRVNGYLQDTTSMDDAKFGGLTELDVGIVLRKNNGVFENYWNAKTNGELSIICASDFFYTDRAPAGSFGARFRNTFAGQEKHGVTVRLEPGDILELLVQDDLTGLEIFRLMAQGHLVTD